jgi:VWFA-related protein
MRKLVIPTILLLAAAAGAPAAQQTPPAPAQQPPPKFRSGVQLIEVDARVFDKDGKFITDLTKDDFEVLEDGAPQRIDAMYLVTGPGAGAPVTPAAPAVPGAPDRIPEPPAPVAPQTWVFYFDLNHLTPGTGFDRAKKAVEDFIALRFKDGDLAGILAGEKMVGNRLTSVRKELLNGLKEVKPRSDRRNFMNELTQDWPRFLDEEEAIRVARNQQDVVDRVIKRACVDDPSSCEKLDEPAVRSKGTRFQQDIHRASMQTLTSINALASGLSKILGPKTVVLLSDGMVVQDIETTLRSVVGQTARAGARIYAIDVRGLNRAGNAGIIDQRYSYEPEAAGVRFDGLADGTNSLAIDTGGLMIRNENNIGRALDRIADDAGRYYVLAYQPANTNFDGKYRAIHVRVKREGLRVRARKGYLALEPSRMTRPQPITAPEPEVSPAPPFGSPSPPEWPAAVPGLPVRLPAPPPVMGTRTAAESAAVPGALRMRPDAERRVRELSAGDPASADKLGAEGWAAYQRGDLEAAIGPLTQAAAQPGVRPWVLYALGLSQGALGHPREAIATWERVRAAVPEFEPVYIDLAATHASLSDLTSALAVLRDAEQRWPNDPEVHNAIGVIHFRRGALDEAIAAFTKATVATPEDALAYLNLGRAYELRFARSRRYVTSQRRWVVDEDDRRKGIQNYQAYIRIGGPYVQAANDGLQRLEWSK